VTTLEQLVNEQKWNDMSDIDVIKTFFDMNNMEEEGIELISELTKTKIQKLKRKHHMSEEWACMLPSKYLYENYDLDTADRLHNLELNYLVNGGELSNRFLKWATEKVPNIIRPEAYFNPLIDYLEEQGIKFKEK
jgi:hypothetical protein